MLGIEALRCCGLKVLGVGEGFVMRFVGGWIPIPKI